MTPDPPNPHSFWPAIIKSASTPLGIFALMVLVVESILGLLIVSGYVEAADRSLVIRSMVGLLVVIALAVTFLAYRRPGIFWPNTAIDEHLAESLGRDVFEAFDGYLRNDPSTRDDAYQYLGAVIECARFAQAEETKKFAKVFVDTVLARAKLKGGAPPDIKGVL